LHKAPAFVNEGLITRWQTFGKTAHWRESPKTTLKWRRSQSV